MKFSTIFSVFLATLSVGVGASPIALPNTNDVQEIPAAISNSNNIAEFDSDLEKRAPPAESQRLQQLQKGLGGKKLQAGKEYAIQVTWTDGEPGSSTGISTPAKKEMQKTQKEYGFDHTAILVGKVQKVQKGKTYEQDFDGKWYHLTSVTKGSGKNEWFETKPETDKKWDHTTTSKTVKFSLLKELDGNWEQKVKGAASAGKLHMLYVLGELKANEFIAAAKVSTDNKNKWQGKKNDCQTYVTAFKNAL